LKHPSKMKHILTYLLFLGLPLMSFSQSYLEGVWRGDLLEEGQAFPLEARIIPSYQVVARLNMLDSYSGLILPMISSATGTFFFRQFYRSIPDELLEAAKLDGSGPWRFFLDILLPLSKTMIAALALILFVVGWNQYLWPLMITTSENFTTLMLGIRTARGYQGFAIAILALLPPLLVVILFQRRFVKGLLEVYK
ncbi:MAG: ABC transporter permease subunit, partial [SAR324 cluster bacterium]|nr:ABC transporter permease subunit [SAR324 cluster bacterium]